MSELGINVAGRAEQSPAAIAHLGAKWARCVAYPDADITDWIRGCHIRDIRVLLVLASESIGQDASRWAQNIATYRDRYPRLIDAWQLGNEADHVSDSSWDMSQAELSELLRTGRNVLGPDAYLIGAGMVSGHPGWGATVDWSPVQALACHPYAKQPHTPALDSLISGYAAYGRAVWVTEYHARTIGMAAALRDDPRVEAALAFCYSDSMVPGFGLIEDRAAMADFKAAAAVVGSPPASQHPTFQLGFAEWAARDRALLGDPLEPERGGIPGFSVQKTSRGRLMAQYLANPETQAIRGWTLTYWRDSDGARFLFANGRSEQIA